MSESSPKPRRRRAARKLSGNHPFWAAAPGGFGAWEPLDLQATLRRDDLLNVGMNIGEILFEAYDRNEALSNLNLAYDQMSLIVFDTFSEDESSFCAQYPYVVNVEFGEMGEFGDYYVFCPSFPALLSVLSTFGPLVRHVPPEEDELRDMVLNALTEQSPSGADDMGHHDTLAGLEEGALDQGLIENNLSSGYADHLVIRALLSGQYADAKRICDRVEHLLPFDADLGQAELLFTRGKIAEAQQDFVLAETYYQGSADRLRPLIDATAEVLHVQSVLALCRIARLQGRIDEAESHLLRAEEGVTAHEAMHQDMGEHECRVRLSWCFEAGATYAARWRLQHDEGAYQQAAASLEQVIELASAPMPRGEPQLADVAREMLRDLRKDHDR